MRGDVGSAGAPGGRSRNRPSRGRGRFRVTGGTERRGRFGIDVNFPDHQGVRVSREARMEVLDGLADERLRLELLLIEALHREAERLAAQAGR